MSEIVNRQGTPEVHRLHIPGDKKGTAWRPVWINLRMSLLIREYILQAEKSFTPQTQFHLCIYIHIHMGMYLSLSLSLYIYINKQTLGTL